MDNINIYAVGGDTVILSGGVLLDEREHSAEEIIKNEPLSVQAGFIVSTEIRIPRCACAADYFSADCALSFGARLGEIKGESQAFTISSTGVDAPLSVHVDADALSGSLSFAGRAKISTSDTPARVVFGGCEYRITEGEPPVQPLSFLERISRQSGANTAALLVKKGDSITPYFYQTGAAICGFSAGSAAIALAFYESENERDYFKAVYHFPKGDREVEMKRYLSEAFEVKLGASIEKRG